MATNSEHESSGEVAAVGFRSERGPVLIALMLSTSLVALDSTIIATAVLSIVGDLGGFSQFPWLFSIYLLAQAVSVPIYGKLADLFGRKKIMLWGIGVFLIGSILCGLAWSMPALIAFRAIQGLGAGAVQPMSITIAGDIYTLRERAKVQGYLASVWAISSVLGPALGGIFSEFLSWRWIFFVNIPLCGLAAWMLIRRFHEGEMTRRKPKIDYLGAGLLTVGAAAILLALLEGGQSWSWFSAISMSIFALGIASLALFAWQQTRAEEPILPLWVFTRRVLVVSSTVSLLVGAIVLGLTSYVPTFVQGVLGTGAIVAGFSLATLTMGWPIAASMSGRVYLRFGFRATATTGAAITVVGTAMATLITADSQIWQVAAMCFVVGLGMGLAASPTLIAAQSSVDWEERGVATSTNMFARSIGSAVGVAIFGAVVNSRISGPGDPDPSQLSDAIHLVFLGIVGAAVLMLVAATLMPGHVKTGEPDPVTPDRRSA
ncbi:MDR family MFS transporter [Rhodococcus sp. G-MC3]|uniref:MDR family MFS transporter n=1 Tax=Rhodococcus sp. G-MC3 TaxID=3046209 RepID=UPI0024BBE10E|nr:MDR family MFS transporter [Rhodococcus sp. G-MC3]MDJ0392584.1 MDR family MFS transporter [Rhodococcus sp. G-MC3]